MAVHLIVGAGRVGTALAASLAADGEPVTLLDRRPSTPPAGVRFELLDVRDGERLDSAVKGAQRLCFCAVAASPPMVGRTLRSVNVGALARLLAAARSRGLERTVVVSSSLVQGPTGSASAPAGAYGRSRLQAEAMARRHLEQGDPVVVLRPHIVIDERPCIFEPQFASLAAGGTLPWPVAWNAVHHLIHTDDLVAACRRALAAGAAGFYGVGSRVTGTLRQLFAKLAERHGVELRVRTRGVRRLLVLRRLEVLCGCCLLGPAELLLHTEGLRYDLGAAARGLGWQPRRTDAEILHDAFAAHLSRTAAAAAGRPR